MVSGTLQRQRSAFAYGFKSGRLSVCLSRNCSDQIDAQFKFHFPEEILSAVQKGERPVLIDVREKEEHQKERVKGAVNIPLSNIKTGNFDLSDIQSTRPLFVHCATGQQAKEAAPLIAAKGFTDVRVLSGGVFELHRNGHLVKATN